MVRRLVGALVLLGVGLTGAGRGQASREALAQKTYSMSVKRIPTPDFSGKTLQEVEEANATAANGKSLFAGVAPVCAQGGVVATIASRLTSFEELAGIGRSAKTSSESTPCNRATFFPVA